MDIFDDFTIIDEPYITREGHAIRAHVLVPKAGPPQTHPVILNWHGGYLVGGHGLHPPFFPHFILQLAKKHSAIIISPDYTLLPHKDGLKAVQDDIRAFHKWMNSSLAVFLEEKRPGHAADLSKVLLNGGSAGGYVALSHALAYPKFFNAVALTYPMIDFDTDWWRKGTIALGAPTPFHIPDALFPADPNDVKKRLEGYLNGPRVSSPAEGSRELLDISVARLGLFHEIFNPDGKLDSDGTVWVNRRVEKGAALPARIWVLHGGADTGVPPDTSVAFTETMKKQDRPIRLDVVEGMEHGFDNAPVGAWKGPDDPIIVEAVAWLSEVWLK